jgi:hypothetical protein
MKAGANLKSERLDRIRDGAGALHSTGRPIEGGEEAVAGGVDLAPAETNEIAPYRGVMVVQKFVPAPVAQVGCLFGGANNVGEEHRGKYAVRLVNRADAGEEFGLSSTTISASASHGRWSALGSSMYFAPGIRSAM